MKYDLVVVGGGPGGLMAAKTAAEDGLKVVLIERKRNITEINRSCSQIFYLYKKHPVTGSPRGDGYIESVSVECEANKTRFHFQVPGFSLDYSGCLRPYLNWIHLSPSGYRIYRYEVNERPWGFYFHKETFLVDLLASVEKAGAEVWPETMGLGVENTKDGVKVQVREKSSAQTLEARVAIAADGVSSKIVDSLGLNEKRQVLSSGGAGSVQYVMEGVETGLPDSSWLTWTIPSLNPRGNIFIGLSAENSHTLSAPAAVISKFTNDPRYAHMFSHARVVKKEALKLSHTLTPIREPVDGNVVIVGDAGAPIETWIQGAVACGYQAVKAIEKKLNGEKGYAEYIAWWQQAFAFNTPEYVRTLGGIYSLSRICSDEDIDHLYSLLQDKIGSPMMLVNNNLELIRKDRPELHAKLIKSKKI